MAEALYPYSREEAKREGELERWRESHRANISCARNLSGLIDTHARQGQLEPDTAQFALKQWGVLRVQFVLSNTLCGASTQEFDPDALHWARTACVPPDKTNGEFKIRADSTLLAQFVQQVHAEYQELGMFGPEHCGGADQDFTGKVLVLRPDRMKDECWSAQNQLWLGEMGFAPPPPADGRCTPPAWAMERKPAGIEPISWVCWMNSICRTGRRRSWRSCAAPPRNRLITARNGRTAPPRAAWN